MTAVTGENGRTVDSLIWMSRRYHGFAWSRAIVFPETLATIKKAEVRVR